MRARVAGVVVATVAALAAPAGAVERRSHFTAAPMPGPGKTEVAGATWERYGVIAVGGGFRDVDAPTTELRFYDIERDTWTRGADLPGARDHAQLVVLDDALYLVGGFTTGLTGATADVWRLDAPDASWTQVASMGTPRGALGAAAIDGRLLAVGGVDQEGRDLASTEWYDPARDRWTPGPVLSRTRQHLGVAARASTAYAIGGRTPNLDTVERLRFRDGRPAGQWTSAPRLRFSRSGNGAATVDGIVCTAGGEEDAGTIAPVECLQRGRWHHVADMLVPRHDLAVVAVGDQLRTISGGPEPGFAFSGDHEVIELAARPSR